MGTVEDHLRAAIAVAATAGDVDGARVALDALDRVRGLSASIVDFEAARMRRAR
jgi:hypothetical protein